jgi:GNAT superfamily N-acetyltransferase
MEIPYKRPAPLTKSHDLSPFDCGKESLNDFLQKYALQNQSGGSARTYVLTTEEERVIGYYSLAPGSVVLEDAPSRISKGQARHPIPIILMARFAIDTNFQGQGLGRALFFDALTRSLHASEEIGGRAFAVHAKDEEAVAFYKKFDMEPSPQNARHLFLLFKDVRNLLNTP